MSCSLLRQRWNDTYQLATSNTRYVVRVYGVAQHTLPEILYELDLLQHLAQYNAPVAAPILRQDGQAVTRLHAPEGTRYLVLFPYAPGDVPAIPIGNQEQSCHFGRALAAIHDAADSLRSSSLVFLTAPENSPLVARCSRNAAKARHSSTEAGCPVGPCV